MTSPPPPQRLWDGVAHVPYLMDPDSGELVHNLSYSTWYPEYPGSRSFRPPSVRSLLLELCEEQHTLLQALGDTEELPLQAWWHAPAGFERVNSGGCPGWFWAAG